jgi:threonine/homoserine/homoserine lactone efflux protein
MNIFVIMVSLLNLVITFLFGVTHHYQYTKTLAKIIGVLYLLFVLISTITAVAEAIS